MNRRSALVLIFLLLSFVVSYSNLGLASIRASDGFPVHNVETGLSYPSIQSAIESNETLDGHILRVDSGTYSERANVSKSLSIMGESRETTIINGGNYEVFVITVSNVTISNFTLVGNGLNQRGVVSISNASNVLVCRNDIVNNTGGDGILLQQCRAIDITENKMLNNWIGVVADSISDCSIDHNVFENNGEGMYFSGSSNNSIRENNIEDNEFSMFFQNSSNYNIIAENNMTKNVKTALRMGDSEHNIIMRNNISECGYFGIRMKFNSNYNRIIKNNISANTPAGLRIEVSTGNQVYHNMFYGNTDHASTYQASMSSWDEGYISGGNYWDGNVGTDLSSGQFQNASGSDGIVDHAYVVDTENVDRYPLMGPYFIFSVSSGNLIEVVSNSTIDKLEYISSNNTLRMNVSHGSPNQTVGFSRICIPRSLIVEPTNVTIEGMEPSYINTALFENATHRWIYVVYSQSPIEIVITPEFPFAALIIVLIASFFIACAPRNRTHNLQRLRRKKCGQVGSECSSQN